MVIRQGDETVCGIPGYSNLLEAIRDTAYDELEEMLDWIGGDFGPEAFSVEGVNRRPAPPATSLGKGVKPAKSPPL